MKKIIIALLLVLLTVGLCISCNGDVDSKIFNANGDCIWILEEGAVVLIDGSYYVCNVWDEEMTDSNFKLALLLEPVPGTVVGNLVHFQDDFFIFNLDTNVLVNGEGDSHQLLKCNGKYTSNKYNLSVSSYPFNIWGSFETDQGTILVGQCNCS